MLTEQRGSGASRSSFTGPRTRYSATADLRVYRDFSLRRGRLVAMLDIFNLTNQSHALEESFGNGSDPNSGGFPCGSRPPAACNSAFGTSGSADERGVSAPAAFLDSLPVARSAAQIPGAGLRLADSTLFATLARELVVV